MRLFYVDGAAGARVAGEAGGIAVIVDALRASVTIATALSLGARSVQPVLDVGQAAGYLGQPGYIVAGERGGRQVEGFDLGNSPSEFLRRRADVAGSRVILTTSNGTRCVVAAAGARAILAGAVPNARAVAIVAGRLAAELAADIYLVQAGLLEQPAEEDHWAAQAIAARLEGRTLESESDFPKRFAGTEAGMRLATLGYVEDVRFCAVADTLAVVPVLAGACFVVSKDAE